MVHSSAERVVDLIDRPERFRDVQPMGEGNYWQIEGFLREQVADELHDYLLDSVEYERFNLADITAIWRGQRTLGDPYFGELLHRPGRASYPRVERCFELYSSSWMTSLLGQLLGFSVSFLRPPTPTKLELGDKIAPHDDMQEPLHCAAVVLNLSKGWKPDFGGATIVGEVDRIVRVPTPLDHAYQVHNWLLTEKQERLPVRFNSLLVLRLKPGVAHGVAEVTADRARLTMVSNFGRADGMNESQWHGQEWLD